MNCNRNLLSDAVRLGLLAGAFGLMSLTANPAFAQSDEGEKADAETLDTVTVTGTRIKSQAITASSPVVEIQREEFQYSGATRVEDLVNQYPQLSPAFDSFNNNPSTGYPTVDLRGLGPQRTLTLVNGFRLATGALEVADISIVPSALISRVDVLTGGASAVYGSDAIAGVVNFVLDTEFEGVSISAGYSAYQHDNENEFMQTRLRERGFNVPDGSSGFDGISKNVDLAIGSSFADGAGHAMAWLTWRDNDPLFQGQRDYSSCALGQEIRFGRNPRIFCGGSNTNAAGNFYFYQPSVGAGTPASLNPNGSFNAAYGAPYNYAPINYYQRPDERYTFGSSLKYEVNEHFKPYLESMMVNRQDSTQIAESGAFFTLISGLNCNNPLIGTACADLGFDPADGPVDVYVAKRNVEGGPRIRVDENNAFRVVAGAEGAITDSWSYNASFLYGRTSDESQGFNDFITTRIRSAILGCPTGSFAGCIPYRVFVPGGVTQAAADALAGISIQETDTSLTVVNAYVTGDLGFGLPSAKGDTVSLVAGFETRRDEYTFAADSISATGGFAGAGSSATPVDAEIKVKELFAEANIPIISDAGMLQSLVVDLGYRNSDYELAGKSDTYKIGAGADFGTFRIRGGFNHAIRAPGTNDLFAVQSLALFGGADGCAGATPEFTLAQCQNTGVTAAQYGNIPNNSAAQYNQFIGGNPNLKPESADSITFGFAVTPIENLQLTIDYYDIQLEETIGTIGAQTILDFCARTGNPTLCQNIRRGASGDLFRGSDPATAGFVRNLTDNFGEQTFRGIDLGANYRFDVLGGSLSTAFQGSYLLEQEFNPLPGVNEDAIFDCVGKLNPQCQTPEFRSITNVRFARDWYTVGLRWRYFDGLSYETDAGTPIITERLNCAVGTPVVPANSLPCLGTGGIGSYSYFDLSASAFIGEYGEFTVGINNVADKEPPLVGISLALNGNAPGGYDQAGRYFFSSFTVKF
ncbi:MAG: TonB-dependent receptor domain-containing protein [Pseudomarimonas sp.]